MSRRAITISEGVGQLLGGDVLLREVLYRMSRSVDDGGMVRPSEAIGPLEGTIDVGDMAETVVLSGVDDLVLQLEDGQRIAIMLTSTHGRFQLRGVGPGPDGLRDFALRYAAAWSSHHAESVAAFFAPGGSLRVNAGAPAVGRHAIAGVAQAFMTALPDLRVQMNDVSSHGPLSIFRWTLAGTNSAPGGTGRSVRISGYEEWRLSDEGLIAESLGHFDEAEYQRQIDGRP
jgi:SnoaL-like domain